MQPFIQRLRIKPNCWGEIILLTMEFKQSAKIFVIILKKKLPKTIGRKLTKESAALFLGIKTMNLEFVFLSISPKIKIKKIQELYQPQYCQQSPSSVYRKSKQSHPGSERCFHSYQRQQVSLLQLNEL